MTDDGYPEGCSRQGYIAACVRLLLAETPERRAELLTALDGRWKADFDAEIARQMTGAASDGG